jgi:xylulose-5-phosphate/fructose-6-phosphate phosphoketolase
MKTNNTLASGKPLTAAPPRNIDGCGRAANYLSFGQIYLYDNPLLKSPLKPGHIKPRLRGDWGRTPGRNYIYIRLNRALARGPVSGRRA